MNLNETRSTSYSANVSTTTAGRSTDTLVVFDIELDWNRHRAKRGRHDIRLTTLDMRLLQLLMSAPAKVFSREEILDSIWPDGIHVGPRTIDVHIASLRKALDVASSPNPVRTIRGRGYSLDLEQE